jgi:hypothetical protein
MSYITNISKSKIKQTDFYEKLKFESINLDFFLNFKVGGLVSQGIITEGMSLNLGPFEDGTFRSVVVTSIKRNRAPCRLVRATQSAALAIECHVNDVRKGMVLVDTRADDIQCTMLFKVTFLFIIFLVVLTCFDRFVSSFFQTSFLS